MATNDGRRAHEHALNALNQLLNESWSYDVLGVVRYELGQAYFWLNKHINKGECHCGDRPEDLNLYKTVLIDVHEAISSASLRPIPTVVNQLKSYFTEKRESHNCICFALNKHSMTHDF